MISRPVGGELSMPPVLAYVAKPKTPSAIVSLERLTY